MFDTTQQSALDAWASHAISFKEMISRTDFQKHWGIYSPVYEEILQIARNASVPILALNAPPELTRKIARGDPHGEGEGDDPRWVRTNRRRVPKFCCTDG